MAEIWMDINTALSEVPVNVMPLVDSADFITVEDAIAYDAAGMDLRWNFVTSAGAYTSTAVTPTTGGVHDWAHQGDGMYSIEIPASGGTINNNTEGFGWFTGKATGVLPWRGPMIAFGAAWLQASIGQLVIGQTQDDAATTTLTAFLNETKTFTITTLDSDGNAVDLSALTLQVVIEDCVTGTDIEVIANASITKTTTTISFATASTTNDVAGVNYRWACRRTDTNEVKMYGPYQVKVAADD